MTIQTILHTISSTIFRGAELQPLVRFGVEYILLKIASTTLFYTSPQTKFLEFTEIASLKE